MKLSDPRIWHENIVLGGQITNFGGFSAFETLSSAIFDQNTDLEDLGEVADINETDPEDREMYRNHHFWIWIRKRNEARKKEREAKEEEHA